MSQMSQFYGAEVTNLLKGLPEDMRNKRTPPLAHRRVLS
jgi:hypothetical protein